MPSARSKNLKTSFSRVFTQEGGAGPANPPVYQGQAMAGTVDWALGDVTKVEEPSADSYDNFDIVDTIKGTRGLPTLGITARMQRTLSNFLRLARKGCEVDLQVHIGSCKVPSDFNGGWSDGKVLVLSRANMTNYSTDQLGALQSDDRAMVMETVPFTGLDYYEIGPMLASIQGAAAITDEVLDIVICDAINCGACGLPSDGCQVAFALLSDSSGSPGLPAAVAYTTDGGSTWTRRAITTLGLAEAPSALACVGTNLVVVSEASNSLHWIPIADLTAGEGTWAEVATGFVGGGEPRAIVSLSPTETWIAGAGGYIYFSDDITSGVEVQTAGDATTQDLSAIAAADANTLVAVGASNAVLVTTNGGSTWAAVTGPAVGVVLNTVALQSDLVWLVGTAGGQLFYTLDGGENWTEKTFSGSGDGQVRDIAFSTPQVGYMAHDTSAAVGRVFRTIDGGFSWYQLPEATGQTFPTNDRINALAACEGSPNVLFAGGLAGDGEDGVVIKAAG